MQFPPRQQHARQHGHARALTLNLRDSKSLRLADVSSPNFVIFPNTARFRIAWQGFLRGTSIAPGSCSGL
jgi:hypothetical protein